MKVPNEDITSYRAARSPGHVSKTITFASVILETLISECANEMISLKTSDAASVLIKFYDNELINYSIYHQKKLENLRF